MVLVVDLVWDTATFAISVGAVFYLRALHTAFKGSIVGAAYSYYMVAGLVLIAGYFVKILMDLGGIDPANYGFSVRDLTIIVSLILFGVGLRKSAAV
jgi:uncharacterized membrane protein